MGKLVEMVKTPTTAIPTLSPTEKTIILKDLKPSKTSSDNPTFSEGWICEKDPSGNLQVKPSAFMSFDDLALNIFYLQTALALAKSRTEKIQNSIAGLIKTQTGEAWEEDETLADHYEKKLCLPTTSRMLRFSLREIAPWEKTRREDLARAIQRKVAVMEQHRDNPESWYKLGRKDFRYTFIPLDFLP